VRPLFTAAIALLSALALKEFLDLAQAKGVDTPHKVVIFLAVLYVFACYIAIHFPLFAPLPYAVIGLSVALFILLHFSRLDAAILSVSVSVFSMIYIPVCLSCLLFITFYFAPEQQWDGRWWLTFLLLATKMTDIGGYVVGKIWGKRKLAGRLSPRKTIEGAIGGICFSQAASVALWWVAEQMPSSPLGLKLWQTLLLALLLSIVAQIGDLGESLFKRDAAVKDSNRKIPGFGGILDMLDAVLFTAPVMLLFLWVVA
jgi:phosphatidate cytidylyltransferase